MADSEGCVSVRVMTLGWTRMEIVSVSRHQKGRNNEKEGTTFAPTSTIFTLSRRDEIVQSSKNYFPFATGGGEGVAKFSIQPGTKGRTATRLKQGGKPMFFFFFFFFCRSDLTHGPETVMLMALGSPLVFFFFFWSNMRYNGALTHALVLTI